jgi:N-acetylmuramoyl-L-alanine amidase
MCNFNFLQSKLSQIPNFFDLTDSLITSKKEVYSTRIPSRVDTLILHHSGSQSWTVQDVANYHVKEKGWPGIGYHLVIDKDGHIFQTNKLSSQSYHCKNHNFRSIGICCLGNFELEEMTEKQEHALMMLLWTIGSHFKPLTIFGHLELGNTLCPGLHYPLIEAVNHYKDAILKQTESMHLPS